MPNPQMTPDQQTRLPLSILDLVPIGSGSTAAQALQDTVRLARLADKSGYVRYWFAEHHNMPSIASSSPEVLTAHVATATERIRIGAGGIMLPNHAPLRIAEAFHTLEALHPGRIDLGIGRAPGTDPVTYQVLRPFDAEKFPSLLNELMLLSEGGFPADHPFHSVTVVPDDVDLPPIWILGSSGASASFAGSLGLGYAFAGHFSPTSPIPAIKSYKERFVPSSRFPKPHVILAVAAVCAETTEHAKFLAQTMDLVWVQLRRGEKGRLPTPEEAASFAYTPEERAMLHTRRELLITGDPKTVRSRIQHMAENTGADEIMISSLIYDSTERLKSYELIAEEFKLIPSRPR